MPLDERRPLALKLEVKKVDLLYKQNISGLLALIIYSSTYFFASWGVLSKQFLITWYFFMLSSGIARVAATYGWRKIKDQINSLEQLKKWHHFIQAMLFISGCGWGTIGWLFTASTSPTQQVFTTMAIIFMSAGAIVCYSASLRAMYFVILPAMLPWCFALLLSPDPTHKIMGLVALTYVILGSVVGRTLNRWLEESFRLTLRNAELSENLRTEFETKTKVELANKAKSVFLANASHEIRTPLSVINGFAESLLQESSVPENIRNDLKVIARNGRYLVSLVNDLLDLSKIETGQIYIQKSDMFLQKELNDALLAVKASFELKNIKLKTVYDGQIPFKVVTDPLRFRQILINLLSNAVKFTPAGEIAMRVFFDHKTSSLSIRISDSGIGMSPQTQEQLFKPFLRGESAEVQRLPGSGLGLALSQSLARKLGGDLVLRHSEEGLGSEFEMKIKVESVEFGPALAPVMDEALTMAPTTGPLKGCKILVVDDSEDLRVLMRRYLAAAGAEMSTCGNGLEALSAATEKTYDVILMDIKMPVMDGYQAMTELRRRGYTFPIIALTAQASTDDRQKCYLAGCDAYLSKPVDKDHLLNLVINQIAHKTKESFSLEV